MTIFIQTSELWKVSLRRRLENFILKGQTEFHSLVRSSRMKALKMLPLAAGIVVLVLTLLNSKGVDADCHSGQGCAGVGRIRACPYDPPGLEVTRGLAGHCSIGEQMIGDCITDEDCFLKKKGNVCCYSRCLGMTQCYKYP